MTLIIAFAFKFFSLPSFQKTELCFVYLALCGAGETLGAVPIVKQYWGCALQFLISEFQLEIIDLQNETKNVQRYSIATF